VDFDLDQAIAVLARTPATLRTLLAGLPEPWIYNNEGPETWSPFDIVGHFIHGEHTDWVPRAQMIMAYGPSKLFEPFDRFAQFEVSRGKSLDDLLDEFEALREQNIAALRGLDLQPADLDREGVHPALGRVTMRQLLATWVAHDLCHVAQVAEVMARQYREEVGPWREYLPSLDQ